MEQKNNIIYSAGIVAIMDNKILLAHPTGKSWFGTYSILKGLVENNEKAFNAALREAKEEVGVNFSSYVSNTPHLIEYKDKGGTLYKVIIYFIAKIPKGKFDLVLSRNTLQTSEVDWAGFLDKHQAAKRIFGKQINCLKHLS